MLFRSPPPPADDDATAAAPINNNGSSTSTAATGPLPAPSFTDFTPSFLSESESSSSASIALAILPGVGSVSSAGAAPAFDLMAALADAQHEAARSDAASIAAAAAAKAALASGAAAAQCNKCGRAGHTWRECPENLHEGDDTVLIQGLPQGAGVTEAAVAAWAGTIGRVRRKKGKGRDRFLELDCVKLYRSAGELPAYLLAAADGADRAAGGVAPNTVTATVTFEDADTAPAAVRWLSNRPFTAGADGAAAAAAPARDSKSGSASGVKVSLIKKEQNNAPDQSQAQSQAQGQAQGQWQGQGQGQGQWGGRDRSDRDGGYSGGGGGNRFQGGAPGGGWGQQGQQQQQQGQGGWGQQQGGYYGRPQ